MGGTCPLHALLQEHKEICLVVGGLVTGFIGSFVLLQVAYSFLLVAFQKKYRVPAKGSAIVITGRCISILDAYAL